MQKSVTEVIAVVLLCVTVNYIPQYPDNIGFVEIVMQRQTQSSPCVSHYLLRGKRLTLN